MTVTNSGYRGRVLAVALGAGLFVGLVTVLEARQFRQTVPIATPTTSAFKLPDGAKPVPVVTQLQRPQVEEIMRGVLEKWNTPEMQTTLADDFYDSSRLMDAMNVIAPRDATLRFQSLQGVQTVSQYLQTDSETGRDMLVSIVSATVRTQLEFNDPALGFQRRPGVNEFIMRVTEYTPP